MIRCIIIDDESSAIEVLKLLLKKKHTADVEVVATATSPYKGKELIDELQPDLVFVDIEMPGMTGIDLISQFSNPCFRVIFVTAFDEYAINAFKLSAVDYLLKPLDTDDLATAVSKAKTSIEKKNMLNHDQLVSLQNLLLKNTNSASRIGIGMADKIRFINVSDIAYCQANGAYTNVFLNDGSRIVASKSLGDFEEQFSGHAFFRIHHSSLINLNLVKEFQRHDGGYVVMQNDVKLEVSQRKRKDFLDVINGLVI